MRDPIFHSTFHIPHSTLNMDIPFTKMVGTGNDFVVVDALHGAQMRGMDWPTLAKGVCNPKRGQGTDGLLVLTPSRRATVRMRIFNPDGSEPSMCGNGLRCLAAYAHRAGLVRQRMTIETGAGIKAVTIKKDGSIRVDMGVPRYVQYVPNRTIKTPEVEHAYLMDSGVPHLVCWVDDLRDIDVDRLGGRLRRHPRFRPQGCNVDFVEVVDVKDVFDRQGRLRGQQVRLDMRTFERGVEGETKACGTGSVAAAASYAIPGPYCVANNPDGDVSDRRWFEIDVRLPGGVLRVDFSVERFFTKRGLVFGRAFLEGDAHLVSRGTFRLPLGRRR